MIKIYEEGKSPGGLNQTSIHLGESNLFIAASVQVVYGLGDPGDVTPDARGQLVVISTSTPILRPARFCWYRMFWSVVTRTSKPSASARASSSPFLRSCQPLS